VTAPPFPLVGDIALSSVQQIDHVVGGGFSAVDIPGLDGDVLQRAGRGSHAIRVEGVLVGDTALDDLGALQAMAASGEEVSFSADIVNALELEQVVIADFRAQAVAGVERLVMYQMWLVESPPLPPPAEVSGFGFGGLDDFGLGDLGFDTDVLGGIADLADQVAGAVDAVMAAADQLAALASLSTIDVGGPLQPLGEAVKAASDGAAAFEKAKGALSTLLGGDG
jgi:hypothetical protein